MGFFGRSSRSSSREKKSKLPPPSRSDRHYPPSASSTSSTSCNGRPATSSRTTGHSSSFASRATTTGFGHPLVPSISSTSSFSSSLSRPATSSRVPYLTRPSTSSRPPTSSALDRVNARAQEYYSGHYSGRADQTRPLPPVPQSSSHRPLSRSQNPPHLRRETACLQDISSYGTSSIGSRGYGQQAFAPVTASHNAYSSRAYSSASSPPPPGYTYDTDHISPIMSSYGIAQASSFSSSSSSSYSSSSLLSSSQSRGLSSLSRQPSTQFSPSPYEISLSAQYAPADHFAQMFPSGSTSSHYAVSSTATYRPFYEEACPASRDSDGVSPLSDTFPPLY